MAAMQTSDDAGSHVAAVASTSSNVPTSQSIPISPDSKAVHEFRPVSMTNSDELMYLSHPDIEVDSDVSFMTREQTFDADLFDEEESYIRRRFSSWIDYSVSSRTRFYLLDCIKEITGTE